jgi:hypothetical protein
MLGNLKRSFGKEELLALAASEELRHRGSGRNRAEPAGRPDRGPATPLFSLVATGQIKLRKLDGYKQLAGVINAQLRKAA